jgi:hypothetical protein
MDEEGHVQIRSPTGPGEIRARYCAVLVLLPIFAIAQEAQNSPPSSVPDEAAVAANKEAGGCVAAAGEDLPLLDRAQLAVYRSMCTTATWFDGFFGDRNELPPGEDVAGRIGVSTVWDQRDGVRPRFRLRARLPLPAFENRLKLLVGRGDERQLIQDRRRGPSDNLPINFRDVHDTAWLLGLGYSSAEGLAHGFDFGAGVRLRIPPDPFVKTAYHYGLALGEKNVANLRETLFWQNSRGFGETSQIDIDRLLTDRFLLRWANSGTFAEDTKGYGWYSSLAVYQDLGGRRSLAYTSYVQGETRAEVPLADYGIQVRYRQSVLRKWFFVEMSTSVTWPRVFVTESRTANFGVGLGVEMYFGRISEDDLH